ncbi:MAG: twin-arginine translocase TatA/TatE family subunit [bacterium]
MTLMPPSAILGGSFSGGEVFLILVVCLLLFGARNLPKIARQLGRSMEEFKRAARDVSHEIMHADLDEEPAAKPPAPPAEEARKIPERTVASEKDPQE